MSKSNLYDNLKIDIQRLHFHPLQSSYFITKANAYFTGALIKTGLLPKLIDSGFIRDSFNEFHIYWKEILGGRPLRYHDFFYLFSNYRKKFQDIELDENQDNFLETWQLPENIYLLFNAIYKYALSPLSFYPFREYIKKANIILEYGCGIAPITYSVIKYGRFKRKKLFVIADIQNHTYHFAKWRLHNVKNVRMIDIDPSQLPILDKNYDLIFLLTVLEHLPNPLDVIKNLYNTLITGGYLIFDFVLGEGKGLDTSQAILEREKILNFIEDKFKLEKGELKINESIGTTIVRKK